jgi:hypothetical protein
MDWALAILRPTPLAPAEQLSTLLLLSGYARNEVRLQGDLQRGMAANEQAAEYDDVKYSRDLLKVVPPDRMPALHALIETGLFNTDISTDADASDDVYFFEFGLARILDGLERYMQSLEGDPAQVE